MGAREDDSIAEQIFVYFMFTIFGIILVMGLAGWALGFSDPSAPTMEMNVTWTSVLDNILHPPPVDPKSLEHFKEIQLLQPAETRARVVSANAADISLPNLGPMACFDSGDQTSSQQRPAGVGVGAAAAVPSAEKGPSRPAAVPPPPPPREKKGPRKAASPANSDATSERSAASSAASSVGSKNEMHSVRKKSKSPGSASSGGSGAAPPPRTKKAVPPAGKKGGAKGYPDRTGQTHGSEERAQEEEV